MEIKKPTKIFIITKGFTWLSFVGIALIFAKNQNYNINFFVLLKDVLTTWDSGHYDYIVNHGYTEPWKIAFFPSYPIVVKIFSLIFKDTIWSGVFLSNLLLYLGSIFMFNLVKKVYGDSESKISLVLFLAAPTSLFYIINYTESAFFFTTIIFFWCLKEKKFLLSAVALFFAATTRNVGILLLLPYGAVVAEEHLKNRKIEWRDILKYIGCFILAISGILTYMIYSYVKFDDFLLFVHAQKAWADHIQTDVPFSGLFKSIIYIDDEFKTRLHPMYNNMGLLYYALTIVFMLKVLENKIIPKSFYSLSGVVLIIIYVFAGWYLRMIATIMFLLVFVFSGLYKRDINRKERISLSLIAIGGLSFGILLKMNINHVLLMTSVLMVFYLWFLHSKLVLSHKIYLVIMMIFFSALSNFVCTARYLSVIFPLWILLSMWILEHKNKHMIYYSFIIIFLTWQLYMNFRWALNMWVN